MYLYAFLRCCYIFTIGYFFKKNRKLVSNMCEIFDYQKFREFMDPEIKTSMPNVQIQDIVNDALPIQLREATWKDGNISLLELSVIIKIVKQYKPKRIFEIGTYDGRTTLNLACNSSEDAVVYTLDLPKKRSGLIPAAGFQGDESFVDKAVTGSRFLQSMDCKEKIIQLFGDSATFDFSPYENKIDLVFIDGAHTYNYILSDSEKALKMLRDGRGIILWHDYSWVWPEIAKALNRLYKTGSRFKDIRHIKGTSLVYYLNTAA